MVAVTASCRPLAYAPALARGGERETCEAADSFTQEILEVQSEGFGTAQTGGGNRSHACAMHKCIRTLLTPAFEANVGLDRL